MLPDRTMEAGVPALKRIRPMEPGLHRDGVYRELFFSGTGQPPASRSLSHIDRWDGYGTDSGDHSR
jgi:hypothetical protein